jgi:hypothetical protein
MMRLWRSLKSWRQLSVGPVSLFYRFGRRVPVSNNRRRQQQRVKLDRRNPAAAVFGLHRQPRTAWTSEMDFRPWNEKFWQHC